MGIFLHELISYKLNKRYPELWRKDKSKNDKDLVCIKDSKFSVEIKTTSHSSGIYGNKSYAQPDNDTKLNKCKAGYFIVISFEKFNKNNVDLAPKIKRIRFGWLDHDDWVPQKSSSGQQSYVKSYSKKHKMKVIYKV